MAERWMEAFIFGGTVVGLLLLGALAIYAERVERRARLELYRRSAAERQRMFDASLERIRTRRHRQRKEDAMGARGQSPPSSTREASAE